MTLKTTEARREAILLTARNAAYLFCEYANIPPGDLVDLCHDADRARELEVLSEDMYERLEAGTLHLPYCNASRGTKVGENGSICCCPLGKEIADLRAKLDKTEVASEEMLNLLSILFTAYEDGADCYEDPEEQSGYLGKAIKLDEAAEHRIAGILNERRPALKERGK